MMIKIDFQLGRDLKALATAQNRKVTELINSILQQTIRGEPSSRDTNLDGDQYRNEFHE